MAFVNVLHIFDEGSLFWTIAEVGIWNTWITEFTREINEVVHQLEINL